MMEVKKAIAMRLPDGSQIVLDVFGSEDVDGKRENQSFMSLDISRVWPDVKDELLASVNYDETKGLEIQVFDKTQADPIFTKEEKL